MARIIMTLIGIALFALGVTLTALWWESIRLVLLAFVAISLLLVGLLVFIFGVSEITGARNAKQSEHKAE